MILAFALAMQAAHTIAEHPLLTGTSLAALFSAGVAWGTLSRRIQQHEEELGRKASLDTVTQLTGHIESIHTDVREIRSFLLDK